MQVGEHLQMHQSCTRHSCVVECQFVRVSSDLQMDESRVRHRDVTCMEPLEICQSRQMFESFIGDVCVSHIKKDEQI